MFSRFSYSGDPRTLSLRRLQFGLQFAQIGDYHDASIHLDEAFGLKAAQIARDQLADSADLCRQLVVIGRQRDRDPDSFALAVRFRQSYQHGCQPMAHCRKGKLLDDADQLPQAPSDLAQYFERNLRMLQAQGLKVFLAEEQKAAIGDGLRRCWIAAAIEYRQLGDRTAWTVDGQYLFASASRTLKDAHIAGFDDVKSSARLAFAEDQLTCAELALNHACSKKRELRLAQAGENRDVLKNRSGRSVSPNVSQGGGERAKSSSIRRRSALNLRKSSYGPSPAGLLAVLAPKVSIFCQGKTHHSPNSACCPNSSRYSLPFSQQRRAVTCNCRYTWRNSSR